VFGGGLIAEICEHERGGLCSFVLRGPDGKTLRQGVAADLASALPQATELLCQLYEGGDEAAA
jgi:tRNA G37 N-methylase TrmD